MRMNIKNDVNVVQNTTPVQTTMPKHNNAPKKTAPKPIMPNTTSVHTHERSALAEQKTTNQDTSDQDTNKETTTVVENETKENEKEKQLLTEIERSSGKIAVDDKGLEFSIHEGTNQIVVRVVNPKTHEVIREIPPEKILDMVAKMIELSGMFIDEKR